ncbi:PTS system galactose-specific transporter subunit IIB [Streptococcus pneumoniae]|nr:PTS system galactose-specific transporter subunit IIB [Streptococcus pneumoniae]
MIKILAACGAGVNSSHQIKSALEEELSNRGYDVHCDAVFHIVLYLWHKVNGKKGKTYGIRLFL